MPPRGTGGWWRCLLFAQPHGRETTDQYPPDRHAGLRMLGQRRVLHALFDFKPRRRSRRISRQGFVKISGHRGSSLALNPPPPQPRIWGTGTRTKQLRMKRPPCAPPEGCPSSSFSLLCDRSATGGPQIKSGPTDHPQGKPINLEGVSVGPPKSSRQGETSDIPTHVK